MTTSAEVPMSDEAIIELARDERNGRAFAKLWEGDTAGHVSHSEADLVLCTMLAYFTGRNPERIERLFSLSALGRRARWKDRPDYRAQTINSALSAVRDERNE